MREIAGLLEPVGAARLLLPTDSNGQRSHFDVQSNYGQTCGNCIGADISIPLDQGVPGASILFQPNQVVYGPVDDDADTPPPRFQGDYFFYHHTEADTVSVLDSDQMDRSAAVLAVTAFAVAMLDAKLPRGPAALQPPEERAMINAQLAAGGVTCDTTAEPIGPRADILTPAQCAVVLGSFTTSCPTPLGGWTLASASQYTCSDECASVFVTAWSQCHTTYLARFAGASDEVREATTALVGTEASPCRMTFTQIVATGMATVAANPTCAPLYAACMADERCEADMGRAWRSTLVDAAETMFETNRICSLSREFRQLYECADGMQTATNLGNGGWQMSDCWERDELPPPVCTRLVDGLQTACPAPTGGWSLAAAETYSCSTGCATSIVGAYHYCGTTFALRLAASANADALHATIDTEPVGACTATFRDLVQTGLTRVASGRCAAEYDQCMTSGRCRSDVRNAIGSNLQVPEAEAAFEREMCNKSPEYQMLYQCLDTAGSGTPWRRASCAAPDKLRHFQCSVLINEIKSGAACRPPAGGWSFATAQSYQCDADCATKLTAAFFECQTSWFADVDGIFC